MFCEDNCVCVWKWKNQQNYVMLRPCSCVYLSNIQDWQRFSEVGCRHGGCTWRCNSKWYHEFFQCCHACCVCLPHHFHGSQIFVNCYPCIGSARVTNYNTQQPFNQQDLCLCLFCIPLVCFTRTQMNDNNNNDEKNELYWQNNNYVGNQVFYAGIFRSTWHNYHLQSPTTQSMEEKKSVKFWQ